MPIAARVHSLHEPAPQPNHHVHLTSSMCGIFFALTRHANIAPDPPTAELLHARGPDRTGTLTRLLPGGLHATFVSTVLSLRGAEVVHQPLADSGSVLCWNGEAWSVDGEVVTGSDTTFVYDALLKASSRGTPAVIDLLSRVRGPYALVFYDHVNRLVYYGRDRLGRRSLLRKRTEDGSLLLSSVCDNASGHGWVEVEADGIYVLDLNHDACLDDHASPLPFTLPFPDLNREIPGQKPQTLPFPDLKPIPQPNDDPILSLATALRHSLALRTQHVREAFTSSPSPSPFSPIAVLFSGGLDCTLLARLTHDLLPPSQPIDLLNVAFENPRIHAALPPDTCPYSLCPDRITGLASYAELCDVCPRPWRFVQINIPYAETLAHRPTITKLMHPHNTEMDLSISAALYFASRGAGLVNSTPYTSTSRVLLSGLGADELFGGYTRHATAFSRLGYPGLLSELALDFSRLGKRNLGRDDRVISHSGREARFPFLDEDVISVALQLRVDEKCDFAHPAYQRDGVAIEPAKRILRRLACDLGMHRAAVEKKRAIQFGARTAKMESGRLKGTAVLGD